MTNHDNQLPLFSCVIPLVEKHDSHLGGILKTLANEQDYISEIIIARSGLPREDTEVLNQWIQQKAKESDNKARIILSGCEKRQSAAENRNRGARIATADWVTFLDADDDYSPTRLRTIAHYVLRYKPNLLVHSYLYDHEIEISAESAIATSEKISSESFGYTLLPLRKSIDPTSTNLEPISKLHKSIRIHHGHLTVRKEIFDDIEFSITKPGSEDGIFCGAVASKHGSAYLIPAPLSIYRIERSATNMSFIKKFLNTLSIQLSRLRFSKLTK